MENGKNSPTPEFFNEVIESQVKPGMVIGFLSEHDFLTSVDSISNVISYLQRTITGVVYTDSYLISNTKIPQIMPSFSRHVLYNLIINTPMFVTSELINKFDTNFSTMYFYDMFRLLGKKALLAQIPLPIISTNYHPINNNEIESIKKKHG